MTRRLGRGGVVGSRAMKTEVPLRTIRDLSHYSAFKVLVLGDHNVGKTCLSLLYLNEKVHEATMSTIGFDFHKKDVRLKEQLTAKLQIWDTAGMERYRGSLTTAFYQDTHGVVLVYDITNMQTFESLVYWLNEVDRYCGIKPTMALVGNKLDRRDKRQVRTESGRQLAVKHDMLFMETSAKDIDMVPELDKLFAALAQEMFRKREIDEMTVSTSQMIGKCCRKPTLGMGSEVHVSKAECHLEFGLEDWVLVERLPSGSTLVPHNQTAFRLKKKCRC